MSARITKLVFLGFQNFKLFLDHPHHAGYPAAETKLVRIWLLNIAETPWVICQLFPGYVYFYLNTGVVMYKNDLPEILNIQFFLGKHTPRAPYFKPYKYTQTFTNDHATSFHQTVKAMSAMI